MIWPYFGNIKMTLTTEDTEECKQFETKNVEIRISFILRNLVNSPLKEENELVNIE